MDDLQSGLTKLQKAQERFGIQGEVKDGAPGVKWKREAFGLESNAKLGFTDGFSLENKQGFDLPGFLPQSTKLNSTTGLKVTPKDGLKLSGGVEYKDLHHEFSIKGGLKHAIFDPTPSLDAKYMYKATKAVKVGASMDFLSPDPIPKMESSLDLSQATAADIYLYFHILTAQTIINGIREQFLQDRKMKANQQAQEAIAESLVNDEMEESQEQAQETEQVMDYYNNLAEQLEDFALEKQEVQDMLEDYAEKVSQQLEKDFEAYKDQAKALNEQIDAFNQFSEQVGRNLDQLTGH